MRTVEEQLRINAFIRLGQKVRKHLDKMEALGENSAITASLREAQRTTEIALKRFIEWETAKLEKEQQL